MTEKFRAHADSVIDFLQNMIANELEDESVAQAIAAFMSENRDSESTADFAHWADGETPESAAHKMTLGGADNVPVAEYIADGEQDEFRQFAADQFGLEVKP